MKPIIFAICLAACSVRAGNPEPPTGKFEGVSGRIIQYVDGLEQPIEGATVTLGGQTAVTNEQGLWSVGAITATAERTALQITREGFAPLTRTYSTAHLGGAFLSERLMPVAARKRLRVQDGGSIVVPGGTGNRNDAALWFPPGFAALDTDAVDVAISLVRPRHGDELSAFPGDFAGKSATLPEGSDAIYTLGAIDVSFSAEGKPLGDVRLKSPADLLLRLDPVLAAGSPEGSTIPTWTLESQSGIWQGEGAARVVVQNGEKYAAFQAGHFTWWNLDKPLSEHACVALKLIPLTAASRALLGELSFAVSGVNYSYTSYTDVFDGDDMAVVTGWRGQTVQPDFGSRVGQLNPTLSAILRSAVLDGAETFSLPNTSASTFYDRGPEGAPLDPRKHCLYLERSFEVPAGDVKGKVLDDLGRPLPGIVVAITALGRTVVSGESGEFLFQDVPWNPDGSVQITLAALARSAQAHLVFTPITLIRNEKNANVTLVAEPVARPPVFREVHLSDSAPPSGGSVNFEVTVADDGASLQWGIELCGHYETLQSSSGTQDPGKSTICHLPPGNPDNAKTVSVANVALDAHLAHGDTLGPCAGVDIKSPPRSAGADASTEATCTGSFTDLRVSSKTVDEFQSLYTLRGVWKTGEGEGKQTLVILAKDALGYVASKANIVAVRNNAPVVFVDAPAYPHSDETVNVSVRATDPDGDPMTIGWRLNGVALPNASPTLFLDGLATGPNYVEVSVSDGKTVVTQRTTLYVLAAAPPPPDGIPPDTLFVSTPPYATAATIATFAFTSADTDVTGFECQIDAGAFFPCVSPHREYVFHDGPHTLAVRAIDAAANADPTPAFATWQMVVEERMVFVANLDAPPVGATDGERRALLSAIITEQFLTEQGSANHTRYRSFIDLQMKRLFDADAETAIDFNPFTYEYRPVTSAVGPYSGPMRSIGGAGYDPTTMLPAIGCIDIPLIGAACLQFYFADIDGSRSEALIDYGGAENSYGIRTVDALSATYRVDVTIPVSIDYIFEPPTSPTLYDRPATEYAYENDLSHYPKAMGRVEIAPLRFTYRVTMPTETDSSATILTFYPIHIGYSVLGDETGIIVDVGINMNEFSEGPFCNNNLATTDTPYAGISFEPDPWKRPFDLFGDANYPGLISDPGISNYSLNLGPYPHAAFSSAGGSGAGRDRHGVFSPTPYAFGTSDNPNNCARPADACTSVVEPRQDGGVEFPFVSASCEYPNVSNNSDDSTFWLSNQFTSLIPYIRDEIKLALGSYWGFYEWDY